jgi:hypothetical protein
MSSIHQRIAARLKSFKEWLKIRLYSPRLYWNGLIKQDTSKDRFIMSSEVNMSNQNKQKRPKYTIEFKQDAAKLVNEKGYTQ